MNLGTEEAPLTAIHALYEGLYSDGFVSARGVASNISEPSTAGGLDLDELEAYLAERDFATHDWVTRQGYLTDNDLPDIPDISGLLPASDFNQWLNEYRPLDLQELTGRLNNFRGDSDKRYVQKSGDTMTGPLTLPALVATNSIKLGSATLTYDSAAKAIHISGAGLYSDSFISARGVANGITDPAASQGIDETELADYLRRYGYITSSALAPYATQSWVNDRGYLTAATAPAAIFGDNILIGKSSNNPYIGWQHTANGAETKWYLQVVTAGDMWIGSNSSPLVIKKDGSLSVPGSLTVGGKLIDFNAWVKKTGDTMIGTLTLPDLVATNSIKLGSATLTYDSTNKAIHLSGAGFYSDSFISARGAASGITGQGTASVNAILWGNRFTGSETLNGPISVGNESSSDSAYVGVSRNSQTLQLLVGSSGARGLWDPNKNKWLVAMNAGNFLQFSAGDYASFEMSVRSSSYLQGTRLVSTIATGIAPLTIASTTLCTNLNADLLDGLHASELKGVKISEVMTYLANNAVEVGSMRAFGKVEATEFQTAGDIKGEHVYASGAYLDWLSVDGDINPMDPGGCCIGTKELPWAEGHFTDIYVGGKLIDFSKLGSGGSASSVAWAAITGKPSTFAPSSHTHAASDITSGTLAIARIPTGTSSTTVALGNHTHSGYAAASHSHSQYLTGSGYERFSCLNSNRSTALELNPTSSTHAVFFGINYAGTIRIGFGDWSNGTTVMSIDKSGNVKIKGTLSQNQSIV